MAAEEASKKSSEELEGKSAGYSSGKWRIGDVCSVLYIDREMRNVVLLGLGFMLSVGAYQTASAVQTVVLNSVSDEYFQGTPTMGYVCMGISNGVQAIVFILGPSLVVIIGPKTALVCGAACLSFFIACFLRPLEVTIYIASAVVGIGVGLVWVVQGYFVTVNSSEKTNGRNTGIFWALYQSSLVSGNLFYFYMLYGAETITTTTRLKVFGTLLAVCIIGILAFSSIKHPWFSHPKERKDGKKKTFQFIRRTPKDELVATVQFQKRQEMLLLIPFIFYIGFDWALWENVYSTCVGYTMRFGRLRESFTGLSGVFVGCGQIFGGIALGFLGKWSHKHGRDPGIMAAVIIQYVCFYLIFINLPPDSPFEKTYKKSLLEPNGYLAMFCSFLLGLGDAIWNNQLMSYFGTIFPQDVLIGFGLMNFWMAIATSIAYFYSTALLLPFQLLILILMSLPAAFGFFICEWRSTHVKSSNKPPLNEPGTPAGCPNQQPTSGSFELTDMKM